MFLCSNSPAHSNPFFAAMTAMISFITAAAAIVPCIIRAHSGAGPDRTETAIPVNTRETPEWGSRVRPRYFLTVSGDFVTDAPKKAPKYLPQALMIYCIRRKYEKGYTAAAIADILEQKIDYVENICKLIEDNPGCTDTEIAKKYMGDGKTASN